jgi:hypothetical protein
MQIIVLADFRTSKSYENKIKNVLKSVKILTHVNTVKKVREFPGQGEFGE